MDPLEKKFRIWEIISRGFAPALITFAIAGATLYANSKFQTAERNRKDSESANQNALAELQLTIARKDEETNIGLKIVENLMARFYQREQGDGDDLGRIEEKMFFLRLTALNFQDVAINLEPFFDQIDEDLKCKIVDKQALKDLAEKKERLDPLSEVELCVLNRKRLWDIGKELARRQAFTLSLTSGFLSDPIEIAENETKPIRGISVSGGAVTIKAEKVQDDRFEATIAIGERKIGPLTASFFDAPLVENVRHAGFRWSVLLEETEAGSNVPLAKVHLRLLQFSPELAPDRIELLERSRRGFRQGSQPEFGEN